jgi:serine phosphatase RsbU (regulator of sigma subunit)
MKIRTQLVVAFLLLAVLPLSGIVLYSYVSSLRAVRMASQQQATLVAEQIDERMSVVASDLRRSVERVGTLPVETFADLASLRPDADRRSAAAKQLLEVVGPAASVVDAIEFVPVAPVTRGTAAAAPDPQEAPEPPDAPEVVEFEPVVVDVEEILVEAERGLPTGEEIRRMAEAAAREQIRVEREIERQAKDEAEQAELRDEGATPVVAPTPPVPRPAPAPGVAAIPRSMPVPSTPGYEGWTPEKQKELDARIKQQTERMIGEIDRQRRIINDQIAQHQKEREVIGEQHSKQKKIVIKKEDLKDKQHEMQLVFGRDLEVPVMKKGEVIGKVRATVRSKDVVEQVLARADRRKGEIPFAIDKGSNLHAATPDEQRQLAAIGITPQEFSGAAKKIIGNWVVATKSDPETGLTFGVARPIRDSLEEVRRAAGRNFLYGLALIGVALLGIVPVANHMTRDVQLVTAGAERIARGDLDTAVPVRSGNEFGQLAVAFNRMASDLKDHQQRLVAQEKLRREQEVEQRVLEREFNRKSDELEQARRFQLSLLPKELPTVATVDISVFMQTATEVGGDYYDFHVNERGVLTAVVGDATGHGAAAGTMVTIVKSLFSAWGGKVDARIFLAEAAGAIRRMDLGRMAMGLVVATLDGDRLRVAAAGMPPLLVHRRVNGLVEEIALAGMPLGTLEFDYTEREITLGAGDAVLMMSDGFPELPNPDGEPLGYGRVEELFASVASRGSQEIIDALSRFAEEWSGTPTPADDVTFVVLKVREA